MEQNYTEISNELNNLLDKIKADSKVYVYNLLDESNNQFTIEEYDKMRDDVRTHMEESNPFTVFSDEEMQMHILTAIEGYGGFGRKFIDNLVDKDPASAKGILEAVMQDYLDLQQYVLDFTTKWDALQSQAIQKSTEESNS